MKTEVASLEQKLKSLELERQKQADEVTFLPATIPKYYLYKRPRGGKTGTIILVSCIVRGCVILWLWLMFVKRSVSTC